MISLIVHLLVGAGGLYLLGAVMMILGGVLICPAAVRSTAAEIGASFVTTLILGAALWPVLGRRPWKGPLL